MLFCEQSPPGSLRYAPLTKTIAQSDRGLSMLQSHRIETGTSTLVPKQQYLEHLDLLCNCFGSQTSSCSRTKRTMPYSEIRSGFRIIEELPPLEVSHSNLKDCFSIRAPNYYLAGKSVKMLRSS